MHYEISPVVTDCEGAHVTNRDPKYNYHKRFQYIYIPEISDCYQCNQ